MLFPKRVEKCALDAHLSIIVSEPSLLLNFLFLNVNVCLCSECEKNLTDLILL